MWRRTHIVLLAAIAAASIAPLLLVGLPGSFASSGQDVGAALLFLDGFAGELTHGHWWPRWLMEGNRGFGSPAFYFYPPIAYWVASGIRWAFRLDDAQALLWSAVLWRLGAAVLVYVWLRTSVRTRAALIGTALFSLHVFTMLVDPLVGFAYAEVAGTCIALLALIAAGARHELVWVPPAFALLAMTHLPLAVMAGGVVPAWAFVRAGGGAGAVRKAVRSVAGCALGAAIAGAYLTPALLLLPEIYSEGWETGGLTTWSGHFLLDAWTPSKPLVHFLFLNAGLLLILASIPVVAWIGRRRLPPGRDRVFIGAAALLVLLCLMTTWLSWPVWWALPPLQRVQFPWRFLVFAVVVWAMTIALRLDRLADVGLRTGERFAFALMVPLAMAALWIPYSALTEARPEFARYDWTRVQFSPPGPRALPERNPPEYASRAAAQAGWSADEPATDAMLLSALARSRAAVPGVQTHRAGGGTIQLFGSLDAPAELLLPQLAFPGWAVRRGSTAAALSTDPSTGLLRIELPAGPVDVTVLRTMTSPEAAGWVLSAAALAVWIGLFVRTRIRTAAVPLGQAV